ncbi:MAG: hypothetical protein MUF52_17005 [Syntrophobacteraceae bacterium]|jgi:hypothetical protein|nr:hypothetical protein [Syntrophobacteraceae bacterium]
MKLLVVRLKSFGALHPGAERWRRVTKESWPFVPGSTLYGAVASTLMRMTCREDLALITTGDCRQCLESGEAACGYAMLLNVMRDGGTPAPRFSPLVPGPRETATPYSSRDYARDAAALSRGAGGILPRAPLDRARLSIHGDRLHGLEAHPASRTYRGFVTLRPELVDTFRKALRWLTLFPFGGGRGKLVQVEAAVEHEYDPPEAFLDGSPPAHLRLLSPAILRGPSDLRVPEIQEIAGFSMRGYRFWRTGLYWEAGRWLAYGTSGAGRRQWHLTRSRLGLPEGTGFRLQASAEAIGRWFLEGLGDPDFTRLGWGQVYWHEDEA